MAYIALACCRALKSQIKFFADQCQFGLLKNEIGAVLHNIVVNYSPLDKPQFVPNLKLEMH